MAKAAKSSKKPAKKKVRPRSSCCMFCRAWESTNGKILFTLDDDASRGICEECIKVLFAKLCNIVEDALMESSQATKH